MLLSTKLRLGQTAHSGDNPSGTFQIFEILRLHRPQTDPAPLAVL